MVRRVGFTLLAMLVFLSLWAPSAVWENSYLSHRDIFRLHLPLRHFLQSEWWAGRWPTWLPYETLGMSFTGSAIGAPFHPLQLLLLVFPADVALKWQVLILWVLSGLGAARLARTLGAEKPGQLLAAIAYAGSGYLTSLTDNFTYLHGAALLPWVCHAAERLAAQPSWQHCAKLAALWALGLLGGDLQALLAQGVFSMVIVLSHREHRLRSLGLFAVAGMGLLALTLPVWPSILQEAWASGRVAGLPLQEAQQWSLHPLRLLELPFGPLLRVDDLSLQAPAVAQRLGGFNGALWARSEFLGATVLLLAPLGIFEKSPRRYAMVGLLALLMALGPTVGLYGFIHQHVLLMGSFRYPEKWMPWVVLAFSMFAARGLVVAVHRPRSLVLPSLLLMAFGLLAPSLLGDRAQGFSETLAGRASVTAMVAAVLALLAWKFPRFLMHGAIGLLVAQGAFCAQGLVSTRPRAELAQAPELFKELEREATVMTRLASWPRRYGFGREVMSPVEAARRGDWASLAPALNLLWGISNIYAYHPTHSGEWLSACGDRPPCASPCARRMGATHCIVSSNEAQALEEAGLRRVAQTSKPKLTVLKDNEARAWASVPGVQALTSWEQWPRAIRAREAGPRTAFIVGEDAAMFSEDSQARIDVKRPRPDEAFVEVQLRDDNYLVLSENCSRNWRVEVNGVPVPLVPADLTQCAVFLKKGLSKVKLQYQPWGWPWVFLPAGLSLVVLLGGVGTKRKTLS